jgi:fucose 4-O-acetylase-like acetyltransferase
MVPCVATDIVDVRAGTPPHPDQPGSAVHAAGARAAADHGATPDQHHRATSAQGATRDPWFDNVRLVAAVLICVMHFGGTVLDRSSMVETIWTATWPFRIPVYVMLAGYFSSAVALNRSRSVALLRNVLFVFLTFEVIDAARRWLDTGSWTLDLAVPEFGLWFLVSLFCWRLALPVLAHLRHLWAWAFVAAVLVGFFPLFATEFSASRTVALFPLFVIGWYLRSTDLHALLAPARVRVLALVVAVGLLVGGALVAADLSRRALVLRAGYRHDLDAQVSQAGIRVAVLLAGIAGALSLIALVPRRRIPFLTYLGSGSMYIYLLHLLVLVQLQSWGVFEHVDSRGDVVALLVGAVALALALASPPVRWATRWLIQPRYTWPFTQEDRKVDPARV